MKFSLLENVDAGNAEVPPVKVEHQYPHRGVDPQMKLFAFP